MNSLELLQTFTRANISKDDLSYLCSWLMIDYKNISLVDYITKIEEMLAIKFFDNNTAIQYIIDHYNLGLESELNNLESQSSEQ